MTAAIPPAPADAADAAGPSPVAGVADRPTGAVPVSPSASRPPAASVTVATPSEKIVARKEDGVGWLIFNQPERRNAVSLEMWAAIPAVLADFTADPAVRVVVMAGAGDKAFVSGADISQFEEERADLAQAGHYTRVADAALDALGGMDKPLVAMIRGYCIGAGLAVAMKADVRIAADDAQFAIPAARLGLAYDLDGIRGLIRLVGPSEAKSMLFSAERLDAQRALRIGLINRVVPVAGLAQAVRDYAGRLSENAPLTLRSTKITIDELMRDPARPDMAKIGASYEACIESEDYREGRRAFMEKRRPRFSGR